MRINASVLDTIKRAIYYKNLTPSKSKDVFISTDKPKDVFAKAFLECISFELGEDGIYFKVEKTHDDITKDLEENNIRIRSQIISLRKTCERSEEHKKQIYEYCNKYDLQWILEEIEKK